MGLGAPRLRATPLLASVPTDPRRRAKREKPVWWYIQVVPPFGGVPPSRGAISARVDVACVVVHPSGPTL